MIVDYDIAKMLSELGFHCKSFWVYIDGQRTHTGLDGFDEGEFNFLDDNFLDVSLKRDREKLEINKMITNEAYPQKKPEIIGAPESEDVILWLETMGVYLSIECRYKGTWSFAVSSNNSTMICNRSSRIEAVHDGIMEGLKKLKKYTK